MMQLGFLNNTCPAIDILAVEAACPANMTITSKPIGFILGEQVAKVWNYVNQTIFSKSVSNAVDRPVHKFTPGPVGYPDQ